ncbi:MAG: hypothetical protein PSU84_19645, partial [Methylobacter sp.]|uniref:hypothetical protein n=1 Tax=Methylobacter sp. TaxID=2051955 RepID=UPI0024883017
MGRTGGRITLGAAIDGNAGVVAESFVSRVPELELSSLYVSIEKHVIPAGIHVRLSCLTPF